MYCFTLHFVPAVDNEDKNITCLFFQILSIGAFLRPEINSLHRYDSCCDNIFVSEHNSKFWESIWKNRQKTNNIQIINSQMLQFFSVKRLNYVSNGNWFTLFVIDIHQIMLISLFPTPFDHFYLNPTLGLKWSH